MAYRNTLQADALQLAAKQRLVLIGKPRTRSSSQRARERKGSQLACGVPSLRTTSGVIEGKPSANNSRKEPFTHSGAPMM